MWLCDTERGLFANEEAGYFECSVWFFSEWWLRVFSSDQKSFSKEINNNYDDYEDNNTDKGVEQHFRLLFLALHLINSPYDVDYKLSFKSL